MTSMVNRDAGVAYGLIHLQIMLVMDKAVDDRDANNMPRSEEVASPSANGPPNIKLRLFV